MNRYDIAMLTTAEVFGNLSYCTKKKVGAVIAKDGRILATGYNGTVSGISNECEYTVNYTEYFCNFCETHTEDNLTCLTCSRTRKLNSIPFLRTRLTTSPFVIHAEQNVLIFCAKNGIPTEDTTMYTTLSPCSTCAKLIVQAGIKRVVYLEEYKDLSGIEFLEYCGIKVERFIK